MTPLAIGGLAAGALGSFIGRKGPSAAKLRRQFGPGALNRDTDELFRALMSSGFGQSQMTNARLGAASAAGSLARNVGAIGGGKSGFGMAMANAAGDASRAFATGNAQAGIYGQASDMAMQNLMARLNAFMQGGGGAGGGFGDMLSGLGTGLTQYAALNPRKK